MNKYTTAPNGLFSWDSTLTGDNVNIQFQFNLLNRSGSFQYNHNGIYKVTKISMFKSEWNVFFDGKNIGNISKPRFFSRELTIDFNNQFFSLTPIAFYSRAFILKNDSGKIFKISPNNIFTRKSTIECYKNCALELLGISVWSTLYSWRRAASNNNSSE